MSYFADLSPYSYGRRAHPGVVHVGWLDGVHEFPKGNVSRALVEKMKSLVQVPVELYRGFHICEVCRSPEARSNGEIRVRHGGITYAAPVGIVHYIEAHGYLPPTEFLEAVKEEANQSPKPGRSARGSS